MHNNFTRSVLKIVGCLGALLFFQYTFNAQAPLAIPFQFKITSPSVLNPATNAVNVKIHLSVEDSVYFSEMHSNIGLMSNVGTINIGQGIAELGNFSQLNWDRRYSIQPMIFIDNQWIDLGSQNLTDVPVALYSNEITLFSDAQGSYFYGDNGKIYLTGPANVNGIDITNLGSIVFPEALECSSDTIHIHGCGGQTHFEYQGYAYPLVEIAGQCWFKENLKATTKNNGESISFSSYNYPGGNIINVENYGYLYGNVTNICPVGWHIPTDCEWKYLERYLGMPINVLNEFGTRGNQQNVGGKLKSNNLWSPLLSNSNNAGLLNLIPAGTSGEFLGSVGVYYSSTNDYLIGWQKINRTFYPQISGVIREANYFSASVRCIKD